MAAKKYLTMSGGKPLLESASQTSAGAGDAGKIPALDSAGLLDLTLRPLPIVWLRDEKADGTHGGTFTAGAYRTRDLNTEKSDTAGLCSLSSNLFTLTAGTYDIIACAPSFFVNYNRLRLYNTTDSTELILGPQNYSPNTSNFTTTWLLGRFTIAASKALALQHYSGTTRATDGFGQHDTLTLGVEVFSEVWLTRIA